MCLDNDVEDHVRSEHVQLAEGKTVGVDILRCEQYQITGVDKVESGFLVGAWLSMKRQQAEIGTQKNVNSYENIFTMRVLRHWKRLPQKAGGSPSIEILKR